MATSRSRVSPVTPAEVIMAKQKWSDLSPRMRRFIIVAGVAEASLKTAMLIDIRRRPAGQIRGSKWLWTALAFVNFFGPVSYFVVGRRRHAGVQAD